MRVEILKLVYAKLVLKYAKRTINGANGRQYVGSAPELFAMRLMMIATDKLIMVLMLEMNVLEKANVQKLRE